MMRVDGETHVMRFLMGLVGVGFLLLLAMVVQLIGYGGWLFIIAAIGGAAAIYILGIIVIALVDRMGL